MKTYLKVSNQGLIVPEDLKLIGSSTKRGVAGKIGMFGSGWKYALAWLIRNDCAPIIYSGDKEIKIDFEVKMHRDQVVKVITVDDMETSLTAEMGPQWTGWMALREIISNAIDEGNHHVTSVINPESFEGNNNGNTDIYIPMNSELSQVMLAYDSYFAFNRKPDFSNKYGDIYLKKEESPICIYRKEIKCYNSSSYQKTKFDVNFYDINISEDRLCTSNAAQSILGQMMSEGVTSEVLLALLDFVGTSWYAPSINEKIINNCKELLDQDKSFTTDSIRRAGGLFGSKPDAIEIPQSWYMKLQELGLVKSLFELLSGSDETFIRTDAKDLTKLNYYLAQFNYRPAIRSGKCESNCFINNGIVYVKDDCQMNDKALAATILSKLGSDTFLEMIL